MDGKRVARVKIQRIRPATELAKISDASVVTTRPRKETPIAHTDS
jgi:hypothetical protein